MKWQRAKRCSCWGNTHAIFLPDSHQRILSVVAQCSWLGIHFRSVFLQLSIRYGRFELNVRFTWLETKGI